MSGKQYYQALEFCTLCPLLPNTQEGSLRAAVCRPATVGSTAQWQVVCPKHEGVLSTLHMLLTALTAAQ